MKFNWAGLFFVAAVGSVIGLIGMWFHWPTWVCAILAIAWGICAPGSAFKPKSAV